MAPVVTVVTSWPGTVPAIRCGHLALVGMAGTHPAITVRGGRG